MVLQLHRCKTVAPLFLESLFLGGYEETWDTLYVIFLMFEISSVIFHAESKCCTTALMPIRPAHIQLSHLSLYFFTDRQSVF